jgi:aminopeptidase N
VRLLANRYSRDMTWQWLRDEWDWIVEMFDGEKSYDSFAKYSAQLLSTREQLGEYREFFTPMLDDPSISRAISVGLNDIEARIELLESDKPGVSARLLEL